MWPTSRRRWVLSVCAACVCVLLVCVRAVCAWLFCFVLVLCCVLFRVFVLRVLWTVPPAPLFLFPPRSHHLPPFLPRPQNVQLVIRLNKKYYDARKFTSHVGFFQLTIPSAHTLVNLSTISPQTPADPIYPHPYLPICTSSYHNLSAHTPGHRAHGVVFPRRV